MVVYGCFTITIWMAVMTGVAVDTSDFRSMQAVMLRIPGDIRAKAFSRAQRRIRDMAKTRVVREAANDADMRVRDVRKVTAAFNSGAATTRIVMRSGWMPLAKLGNVRQTGVGVTVRGWGSHKGAFIATMRSGHTGVFVRSGSARLPIKELWGPNPVSFIHKDERKYLDILTDLMQSHYAPRVLHEIDNILRTAG